MNLTKYKHACFSIETDNKLLIVDPGVWTTDLPEFTNVVAVIITHEHSDHFDMNILTSIASRNPNVIVYAHESVINQLGTTIAGQAVTAGESIEREPFHLEFFGGTHATIHESFEPVANLGVMINHAVYYPGDSFTLPLRDVKVLALPVTAPWLKISEAMDFVSEVKAELVFPTHDAVASDVGKQLPDRMIPGFVEAYGGTYQRIATPIEIDG